MYSETSENHFLYCNIKRSFHVISSMYATVYLCTPQCTYFFIHKYFGNLTIKTLFAPQRAEKRLRSSRVYYQQKLNCFNWLSGKYALCELQPIYGCYPPSTQSFNSRTRCRLKYSCIKTEKLAARRIPS